MADMIQTPFAANGDKDALPNFDPDGGVSYKTGYTDNYERSLNNGDNKARAIERRYMNYLFYLVTSNIQEWQQNTFPKWDNTVNDSAGYAQNAFVSRQGKDGIAYIYRSLTANNKTDPLSDQTGQWEVLKTQKSLFDLMAYPRGGGDVNAMPVSAPQDLNSFNDGLWVFATSAIINSCANSPSNQPGILEQVSWKAGDNSYIFQRYSDIVGVVYTRLYSGSWSSWANMYVPLLDCIPYPKGAGNPNKMPINTAVDFNSTPDGLWALSTPDIVRACPNSPTAYPGALEQVSWALNGTNFALQKYTDIQGNINSRLKTASSWGAWSSIMDHLAFPGRLLKVATYVNYNVYKPLPNAKLLLVEIVGAGGAGGGAIGTNTGAVAVGTAGGAGAFVRAVVDLNILNLYGGIEVIGGVQGVGVYRDKGGDGQPSYFGSYITCKGGNGGVTSGSVGPGTPVFTGQSQGGTYTITATNGITILDAYYGASGMSSCIIPNADGKSHSAVLPSMGANSPFGSGGGNGVTYDQEDKCGPATGYGAGGGAAGTQGPASCTGGDGAPGCVRIWEFS